MKKLFISAAIAIAVVLSSCEKEDTVSQSELSAITSQEKVLIQFIELFKDQNVNTQILHELKKSEKTVVLEDVLNTLQTSMHNFTKKSDLKESLDLAKKTHKYNVTEIRLLNYSDTSNPEDFYFTFIKKDNKPIDDKNITVYDINKNQFEIDSPETLDQPLIILDDFSGSSLNLMINEYNRRNKLESNLTEKQFYDQLILKTIRLKKDHEPSHRGAAEIYGILVKLERDSFTLNKYPTFTLLNMDYLDHDGQLYGRNDILAQWWGADYDHVGLVIMEYDGNQPAFWNHNLNTLFTNGEFSNMSEKAALKIITQKVASKLKNHDDYVDQFYYFPDNEPLIEYLGKEKNARVKLINKNRFD